jgi:hypothetical protein
LALALALSRGYLVLRFGGIGQIGRPDARDAASSSATSACLLCGIHRDDAPHARGRRTRRISRGGRRKVRRRYYWGVRLCSWPHLLCSRPDREFDQMVAAIVPGDRPSIAAGAVGCPRPGRVP